MLDFLQQPYPGPVSNPRRALLFAAGAGLFVAGFLIFFRPFGTAQGYVPGLNAFLAGYGLIVFVTFALPVFLLPLLAPRWSAEANWTVGKQLLLILVMTTVGLTLSYFYLLHIGGTPSWISYAYFYRNGLLIAVFPITLLVLLDYIRKLRHYQRGAADHNTRRSVGPTNSPSVAALSPLLTLHDNQERPVVEVPADRLWCLHAEGNYVEVWWQEEAIYRRKLIRNTLQNVQQQLPTTASFLHCHRSWVVNAALVESVTGNAQGYHLHRAEAPAVPVARGRSKRVLAHLAATGAATPAGLKA